MMELIDTGELIGMLLLAGLAAFILWESLRREKPVSPGTSSTLGQTAAELGLLIGAAVLTVMGILACLDPTYQHSTGRHAFFWNALYEALGMLGIASVLWATAIVMLCVWYARRTARLNTLRKESHSGR